MSITKDDGWFVGEDQTIEWDIRDAHGAAVAISGWSIQFRMSVTKGGASVLTKSGTVVQTSRCRVTTLAADTTGLTPGVYYYTLSRTDSGSNQVLDPHPGSDGTAVLQARVV